MIPVAADRIAVSQVSSYYIVSCSCLKVQVVCLEF